MKLVSGGSSSVNLSIQISRSAIGWAVNFVLSYKNRTEKNKPKRSSSTQDTIFYCIRLASKCILMWLSLADDRGVAMLEPTSCKMHCICNEKKEHAVRNRIYSWCKMSAIKKVNKCKMKTKPCPADMWTCGLCRGKTLWPSCNVQFNTNTLGGADYTTRFKLNCDIWIVFFLPYSWWQLICISQGFKNMIFLWPPFSCECAWETFQEVQQESSQPL